jgi:putative transposase
MAACREWLNGAAVVWTDANRARYDRRGQRYPSDLTDAEWAILEPLLPVAQGSGRPRQHVLREVLNGIPWDALPKDLPPHSICSDDWRLLTDGGHLERINHHLVMADREKTGRGQPDPGDHQRPVCEVRCAPSAS